MKSLTLCGLILVFAHLARAQEIPSAKTQIKQAQMALNTEMAKKAKIYGYASDGTFITLREGSNEMICLADDPFKSGFSVAAYHSSLNPYMARGRELKKEGKKFQEIFDIRGEEIAQGLYEIPDKSTLYVLIGELNEQGEAINTYLRYVVYIPFATSESTGLPLNPLTPGGPWLMNPNTYRAHIMINPAKTN